MAPGDENSPDKEDSPDYSVYRASRNPLAKLREGGFGAILARFRREGDGEKPPAAVKEPRAAGEKPLWRKAGRWILIGAVGWLLLSIALFAVSAQIQKSKLDDRAADELGGFPLMIATGQTILVMGTDARPEETLEPGAETNPKCIRQASEGAPPSSDCEGFRADTLMLVRAGGGSFEKLSIPRDTFAAIPGAASQKVNAAYAIGGAALQIQTVEQFLGIDIDHVVILDFEGFADFIDAIGGVEVALRAPVKSEISGGAANGGITLELPRGRVELDGQEALALARTRVNLENPAENDIDRALRQQLILAGIQDRLTSITRIPINFLRGPLIAWNAPKAMVSDMGALALPQLALSVAIGGNSNTNLLTPSGAGPGGSLSVPVEECRKAVRKFLDEEGDSDPVCSPAG